MDSSEVLPDAKDEKIMSLQFDLFSTSIDRIQLGVLHLCMGKIIIILYLKKISFKRTINLFLNMSTKMFSEVGKTYDRSKAVCPLNKEQREKIYGSCEIKAESKSGQKKFSPFNTISRSSRNSYLLRVTKEPNTKTNYQMNFNTTLPLHRRATIDKAPFERIIGSFSEQYEKVQLNGKSDKRCINSFKPSDQPHPLTVRETHDWRKTFENLDFKKQPKMERETFFEKLTTLKTTRDSKMMQALQNTTESNFNNFKRFSLKVRRDKAHSFNSDSKHQYLKSIETREIEPEYNVTLCREQFTRKSMKTPKGQVRFYKNKEKIATRFDRADKHWVQTLDYNPEDLSTLKEHRTIDLKHITDRQANVVHSKYPIRLSLQPPVPFNHK